MLRFLADLILAGQRVPKPLGLLVVSLGLMVGGTAAAQSFVKGYATNDPALRPGMAVVLSDSGTAEQQLVERAGREDRDRVIGIATTIEESLVTVTSKQHQVYVKNSGVVATYVSDVNGDVKKGDKLTTSPLKGILMRSEDNAAGIGVASEDFSSASAEGQTISTDNGERDVLVAKLAVTLDNNLGRAAGTGKQELTSLQRLGKSIVGKEVGELQVIIALIIFFIMMIAEGGIIYGAVSSSITSLGRNPLAKTIIVRELTRILGVVVIVLLVGLAAIYAVLLI